MKLNKIKWQGALLSLMLVAISSSTVSDTADGTPAKEESGCGDCSNPLVQIMPLKIGGDIPDFSDYVGWESIRDGMRDFCDDWARGFEVATSFMKNNPCADIFYEMENPNPHADPVIHIGPPGKAKYEVRSWAVIEKAAEGEKTLVRHIAYRTTPLQEPKRTPGGNLEWNDVQELSNQLETVPLLGRIQISHDLVALKNEQIYDSGTEILDWIASPPTDDDSYFQASGESASIGGEDYSGNDGIMVGEFTSMSISGATIFFDRGDIGKTIRLKETPVSFSIQVDYNTKYPPYYVIKVTNLKNELGEALPDNVRIALKVSKGALIGGEEVLSWQVYNTKGGRVSELILYKPPPCSVAKTDIIEYAGVCEYNDFDPYIMLERRQKEFPIECGDDAILTVEGKYVSNSSSRYYFEDKTGVQRERSEKHELQEASFFVPLELVRRDEMPLQNQSWEFYRPKDIRLSSCNIFSRERAYKYASHITKNGYETSMTRFRDPVSLTIAAKEPLLQSNIIVVIDNETDRVVKVMTEGFAVDFFWHERYSLSGRSWSENGTKPISDSESKTDDVSSEFSAAPVEDPVPDPTFKSTSESLRRYFKNMNTPLPADIKIPEDQDNPGIAPDILVTSGDGKRTCGGEGRKVLENERSQDYSIYSEKTFNWQLIRNRR